MTPTRLVAALIFASAVLRLAMAGGLGVGTDEAYYALLASRLDWSYFDHPPMLAMVGRLGLILGGGTLAAFPLRVGFVALFSGSTWLMFRLTSRLYGEGAGAVAAVVLNASAYFGLASGTFALPDGPLLFFWLLTLDRLAAAVSSPMGSFRPWMAVGLAWGGALLSKYSAALLPIGAIGFLLADPAKRCLLRRPGPWLAAALGLAMFAPVIVWNATHQWASFAFQGERASGMTFRPLGIAAAVAGQALYVFPWVWIFLVVALARAFRRREPPDRFLLWQALPPLAAYLMVAARREVLPHWSLVGLIPAFPLLGRDWADLDRTPRRLAALMVAPVVLAVLVAAQGRWGLLPLGAGDPTADLAGWKEVVAEMQRRGLPDRPGDFVFTSNWRDSGQLAFAADGRISVHCYAPRGGHNFDLWDDPEASLGRSGLLVTVEPCSTEPAMYDRWFERIEPAGTIVIARPGGEVRRFRLSRCVNQVRPFRPGAAAGGGEAIAATVSSPRAGRLR